MDKLNKYSYNPSHGVEISFYYAASIVSPVDNYIINTSEMEEIDSSFASDFISEIFVVNFLDIENDLKMYKDDSDIIVIESIKENFTIRFEFGHFTKVITDKNQIELNF